MTPWLSIVVPTVGERHDGLLRTIESVRQQPAALRDGVEVVIVADTHGAKDHYPLEVLRSEVNGSKLHYRWLEHDAGVHCFGQPQRTIGARAASGDFVGFSQDDNILAEGALDAVWSAVTRISLHQPLFFRVLTPWRAVIWSTPQLMLGNIDADCLVLPRAIARDVIWGLRYEGDFDAAVQAMQYASGDVNWCEQQIAIARPEAEHIWW